MGEKSWRLAAFLTGVFAVYFVATGWVLRDQPPSAAEDAVGLGLMVIGGGFALAVFICGCGWLSVRNARSAADEQPPAT